MCSFEAFFLLLMSKGSTWIHTAALDSSWYPNHLTLLRTSPSNFLEEDKPQAEHGNCIVHLAAACTELAATVQAQLSGTAALHLTRRPTMRISRTQHKP